MAEDFLAEIRRLFDAGGYDEACRVADHGRGGSC